MDDRFNTIAGWTLFGGVVALGLTAVSTRFFHADKDHRPETMGYEIEGVVSSDGGEEAVPIETLLAAADPAKGEAVFAKCKSCHTIDAGGANGIGPNLHGVMGEPIGTGHGGFAFSEALKGHGGKWDFANMDAWLHNPKKFAPGTKMTFAGLGKPEDRANLIVYMNAQGSNLPLPAAPAPAEVADQDPAEGGAEAAAVSGAEVAPIAGATAAASPAPEE